MKESALTLNFRKSIRLVEQFYFPPIYGAHATKYTVSQTVSLVGNLYAWITINLTFFRQSYVVHNFLKRGVFTPYIIILHADPRPRKSALLWY